MDEDDHLAHDNWKSTLSSLPPNDVKRYLESVEGMGSRELTHRLAGIRETFEEVRLPLVLATSTTRNYETQRLKSQDFR